MKVTGYSTYVSGIKHAVSIPLGMFSLKRSTDVAFAVPFRGYIK